jgi:syntaxin 17
MFTRQRSASTTSQESEVRKFPIHRLQQTIDKFIKVLEIDVDRLNHHKYNLEKYSRYGDHRLLCREHINASRTVQQLKANLIELDRTRLQVEDKDLREFDRRTVRIRDDAAKVLGEFMEACRQVGTRLNHNPTSRENLPASPSTPPSHDFEELPNAAEVSQMQRTAQLVSDYEAMIEAERSWQRLQNDLEDLHDLMQDLSRMVHEQQVLVDSIEENIDRSQANVQEANEQLSKVKLVLVCRNRMYWINSVHEKFVRTIRSIPAHGVSSSL